MILPCLALRQHGLPLHAVVGAAGPSDPPQGCLQRWKFICFKVLTVFDLACG